MNGPFRTLRAAGIMTISCRNGVLPTYSKGLTHTTPVLILPPTHQISARY